VRALYGENLCLLYAVSDETVMTSLNSVNFTFWTFTAFNHNYVTVTSVQEFGHSFLDPGCILYTRDIAPSIFNGSGLCRTRAPGW